MTVILSELARRRSADESKDPENAASYDATLRRSREGSVVSSVTLEGDLLQKEAALKDLKSALSTSPCNSSS